MGQNYMFFLIVSFLLILNNFYTSIELEIMSGLYVVAVEFMYENAWICENKRSFVAKHYLIIQMHLSLLSCIYIYIYIHLLLFI